MRNYQDYQNCTVVFAALKLVEQLYLDGCISETVFAGIKKEYSCILDLSQFTERKEIPA